MESYLILKTGIQTGRLSYNLLVDSKTQLKELLDKFHNEIGKIKYESLRVEQICYTTAYLIKDGGRTKIGEGSAALQKDAEQVTAGNALAFLKRNGYSRAMPEAYAKFCDA